MMAARQRECGEKRRAIIHKEKRRAIIHEGFMFFSAEDLSDAAPIPVEDCKEFALGVALAQYSIGDRIKTIQEQGEAGVSKELTQMHDMHVFCPLNRDNLTKEEKAKALTLLIFLKKKGINPSRHACAPTDVNRGETG